MKFPSRIAAFCAAVFGAFGVFAATPANGSFEELAKFVPANSSMVIFMRAGELNGSGWLKQLDKMPVAKDMLPDAGVSSGDVVMFSSDPANRRAMVVLVYDGGVDTLDKLMEQGAAGFAAAGCLPEKTTVCDMPAYSVAVPKINETAYYAMLDRHWFIIGMSEKAISDYINTPAAGLGMAEAQVKTLAPYKAEVIFGTVGVPEAGEGGIEGVDIVGSLRGDALIVRTVTRFQTAEAAQQMQSQMVAMKPMFGALLEQQLPGCGKLLADSMEVTKTEKSVIISFSFTPELFVKMVEAGKKMEKSGGAVPAVQ